MQKIPQMGVQQAEHENYYTMPDWAGARVFLEVMRSGSFRGAALKLGMSVNTLRGRLSDFERQLGLTLVTRHVDGVRITAEGELVLAAAKRMETASFDFMRVRSQSTMLHGEVRLSVTEGLGTFWLAPRIVEFQRAHPQLIVNMRCAMHPADVLRLETDLAVQITPPRGENLKVVKLGRLHAMPFASQEYLNVFGCPKTREELQRHRIVLQLADQITSLEDYNRIFPGRPESGTIAIKTNVSSAHYWFIARAAGIGMLPTYAPSIGARVVPVEVEDVRIAHDIWLTYHPDASKMGRVRRLIDWLVEAFSPKRFPWFRDEFIHPRDLPARIDDAPISELFEGFAGMDKTPPATPEPPAGRRGPKRK
jgi:DNA-binding transcriptional LysR family regulator